MVDSARDMGTRRLRLTDSGSQLRAAVRSTGEVRLAVHDDEVTQVHATASDVFALALRRCERTPGDLEAWDRLEAVARARSHADQVVALYRKALGGSLPVADRLTLGARAVRFHEEWSDDEDGRLGLLTQVLALDPDASWAFERVALQLTRLALWDDLLALYDRAIGGGACERRSALLREAANVARDLAGQPERAVPYLEQLLESGELTRAGSSAAPDADTQLERIVAARSSSPPARSRALDHLRRAYDPSARADDLLRLLGSALATADGVETIALHAELARRLLDDGRKVEALEHLAAVLALDAQVGKSEVLEGLLSGSFEGTLAGCRLCLDKQGGRALVKRGATLAISSDPRSPRALDLLARLHADAPDDAAVVAAFAQIHLARGSYSELLRDLRGSAGGVPALERSLASASDADRVECVLLLAHLHVAAGGSDRALAVLEESLRHAPEVARVRELQLELLRPCAAAKGSQNVCRTLVDSLVEGATHAEAPAQRAYLREAARVLAGPLAAPGEAVDLLDRVVTSDPEDVGARAELADALRRVGRLDEARAIAEGIVQQFGRRHPRERAASHVLLARIARAGGRDGDALAQLELAVSIDPAHLQAQRLLGKVCLGQGQPARAERAFQALLLLQRRGQAAGADAEFAISETLFDLHRVALLLAEPQRAAETLASAFEVASRDEREALRLEQALVRARRYTEALELALRALARDPASESIHERAHETSVRADRVESYAARLESLAQVALSAGDGGTGCALLRRLGHVRDRDLGQLDQALCAYRSAEDTSEDLVEVWRAMASVAGRLHDRETRLGALRKLAGSPELRAQERAEVLRELADHELEARDTVDAGLASLRSALADGVVPGELAVASLRKALQVAADREPVVRLYEAVARSSGDDHVLLDALWASSTLPSPDPAALEEAFALAARLGEDERAARLLERAVEVARERALDPAEALWAMRHLAQRSEVAGCLGDAILWMTRAAELADADESWTLLERAAELAADPHGDLDLAAHTCERMLEREVGHRQTWERLLAVLRRMAREGNAAPLDLGLARAAEELREPDDRNRARMERVGGLLAADRRSDARECLRAVLAEDPDHTGAAAQLADLLQEAGEDEELAKLLGRILEGARIRDDVRAGVALALRLGNLLAGARCTEAADVYRTTLEWVPDHPRLLRRLVAVLDPVDDAGERAERIDVLLVRAEGPARFELALELFEARRVLGDAACVEQALETAHGVDPHNPALREPTRWLADSLRARAAELPEDAVALLVQAARLLRDRLDDTMGARTALESALAMQQDAPSVVEPLVQCLIELGEKPAAVAVVDGAIERCAADDATMGEWLALRASVHADCDRYDAAVEDMERAVAVDGDRWLPALNAALRRARRAASECGDLDAERGHALRESDLLGRSGETASARALLADLVSGTFYDRDATQRLLAMDVEAGQWDDVARSCQRMLDMECGPQLVDLALLRADACEKLGIPDDARRGLERAHGYDPGHPAVRARLRALYERVGAHRELADLLEIEAQDAPDDPDLQRQRVDALMGADRSTEAEPILVALIARHAGKRSRELAELQHRMARIVASRDPQAQLTWLVAAFESFPRSEPIARDLADAATRHQHYELALRAWRATVTIAEGTPALRAMAYVRQAQIARAQGDQPRAVFLARKARSEGVEVPEATELLGQLGARL
jgi:tetratricopeptide (TPR) repeat protein